MHASCSVGLDGRLFADIAKVVFTPIKPDRIEGPPSKHRRPVLTSPQAFNRTKELGHG